MSKVAIVTGASGIVGTSIIEQLLQSKADEQWSKVIAVSRREPMLTAKDDRLVFLPLDLELEESEIAAKLREIGATDVTHVFFTAYVHDKKWDPKVLYSKNVPMFKKFIQAIDSVATGLQRVELQTGGKYYGVHLGAPPGGVVSDDTPRYTNDPDKPDFYFGQEDFLKEFQRGKHWKYTIYRPMTITGVTRGNGMSIAPTLAVYFLIQKHLGKKALYPGNEASYRNVFDTSNADIIAKFAIWTSTQHGAENEDFIIVDHDNDKQNGEELWKGIAKYFGVETEEPTFPVTGLQPKGNGHYLLEYSLAEYMKDKKDVWKEIANKHGLEENVFDYCTWEFVDAEFSFSWPQLFRMPKAKRLGWKLEEKPLNGFIKTFDKMKKLKMIP